MVTEPGAEVLFFTQTIIRYYSYFRDYFPFRAATDCADVYPYLKQQLIKSWNMVFLRAKLTHKTHYYTIYRVQGVP